MSASLTFFERHRHLTILCLTVLGIVLPLAVLELVLRFWFGLGDPVLYRSSPLFGYRLQPNQLVYREHGAEIRVNNLGLRANADWDTVHANKVLFLGNSVTYGGSYITNTKLFSHLAVEEIGGYLGGNGGVNGWGVENIHALVVEGGFTPAAVYVSVLQEMDFYRGLSKLSGKPFWAHKPGCAISELLQQFFLDRLNSMYEQHDRFVTIEEQAKTIERAALRLKELDMFLKERGYIHLIFMSTNVDQVLHGVPSDSLVSRSLAAHNINAITIRDRPEIAALSSENKAKLFYDWNHLSEYGHRKWADIIQSELKGVLQQKGFNQ